LSSPPVDVAATIARIRAADSEIKAWCAFSAINAANGTSNNDFSYWELLKALKPVRGELVEPHSSQQNQLLTKTPFDKLRANGGFLEGPYSSKSLKNLTVGVKDIIDVAGLPTRMGSAIFDDALPATRDATCVALMKKAGAIIIGKTVTTELATFVPAATRNPLNLNHTPGGSSAGAAAAVAAGHVDIAIGTQTAGSILRPAAYCGVIGFKPSFGLVSTDGVLVQSPSLDTVGVFSRSAEHCAAWLAAMTGEAVVLTLPAQELKIGIITNWGEHASDEMQRAIKEVQTALNQAGHHAKPLTLPAPLADMHITQKIIQDVEAARAYATILQHHRTKFTPALAAALDAGAAIDDAQYQRALKTAAHAKTAADALFDDYDIWLMPAAPSAAPLGLDSTGDTIFNRLASGLGLPAVSVPFGLADKKLPLGIQLIARRNTDAALLSTLIPIVKARDCAAQFGIDSKP
jgi:Asp-tRNA(Asn)/Glu-tRNA(Gln) amidotransferase A subunit family amidase